MNRPRERAPTLYTNKRSIQSGERKKKKEREKERDRERECALKMYDREKPNALHEGIDRVIVCKFRQLTHYAAHTGMREGRAQGNLRADPIGLGVKDRGDVSGPPGSEKAGHLIHHCLRLNC